MAELSAHVLRQPDSISCGPTALAMLVSILHERQGVRPPAVDDPIKPLSIMMIRDMIGSNGRTGTTDIEIGLGLRAFAIDHRRLVPAAGRGDTRLNALDRLLWSGGCALLRTMKGGCRHWLLAAGMTRTGETVVLDPAGATLHADRRMLDRWLAPRGHEIWPIPPAATARALGWQRFGDDRGFSLAVVDRADIDGGILASMSLKHGPAPDVVRKSDVFRHPAARTEGPLVPPAHIGLGFDRLLIGLAGEVGIACLYGRYDFVAGRDRRHDEVVADHGAPLLVERTPRFDPLGICAGSTVNRAEYPEATAVEPMGSSPAGP